MREQEDPEDPGVVALNQLARRILDKSAYARFLAWQQQDHEETHRQVEAGEWRPESPDLQGTWRLIEQVQREREETTRRRAAAEQHWREFEEKERQLALARSTAQAPAPPTHVLQPAPRQRQQKRGRQQKPLHNGQQATPARHWQPGDLLTVEDAVRFTQRHEQTVRNWYRSGALQVLQPGGPGGAVLIPFENLLACQRRQEASA